jgi:hypothetical protein
MTHDYRDVSEWCAFIDVDEFLCPKGAKSVPEVLQELPPDCGALYVHWLMFGSSGYISRQPGLVTETFLMRGFNGFPPNRIGKTILRLSDAGDVTNVHLLGSRTRTINDSSEVVQLTEVQDKASHRQLAVHHYFCKSLEEWRTRRSRGRATKRRDDPDFIRTEHMFETHDVNQVHDDGAARIMKVAREAFYPLAPSVD